METAGSNDDASRQPDGVQGTAEDDQDAERALSYIHAARAALGAAEDHLRNSDRGRAPARRIAASLALAIAETNCFRASEALAIAEDSRSEARGSVHRRTYRPPDSD
jgi:hypothetical protein